MTRSPYLRHLAMSMGTRVAMIVLRLLRNVLLARILGPSERGVFALLSALPELISAVTSGGLNSAIAYQAAQQRAMGLLLSQVLVFGCLLGGLATWLGVWLLREFGASLEITRQLGLLAWLLLLAVPLAVLKNGLLNLHNASGGVEGYNGLRLIESAAPLLLFLALFWMWQTAALEAALITWLAGLGLVVAVGCWWLSHNHELALRWDRQGQNELLHYSAKSHPETLFRQVISRADYLFISTLLGSTALGFYAMASAAADLLTIVTEAVTTPLMKRLLQQGEGIESLTAMALRLTSTVMICACAGMALLGEWLIVTLFGAEYRPAYPALLALLPGSLGLCFVSTLRLDLLGKNRPGSISLATGLGALLNLVLNLVLIPRYGIVGAAIASSATYLAVAACLLALYCRLNRVPVWQTLFILPGDLVSVRNLLTRSPA